MVLSKRERVIRTLELNDEPDMIPIHYLGFERTGTSYGIFLESAEYKEFVSSRFESALEKSQNILILALY